MGSQRKSKPKALGLQLGALTAEELESVALAVESEVSEYLLTRLPKSNEADVVVKLEKTGDGINVVIDAGVRGRPLEGVNYADLLASAIALGKRRLERELLSLKKAQTQG